MFMSGGLFAASGGLAAPLPPDYVSATQGMQFALFQWWCPFDLIKINAFASPAETVNASNPLNETTPLIGSADVGPAGGGRRLLSEGARALARVLCAPSLARVAAEENAALREARALSGGAHFLSASAHPARRRLLQLNTSTGDNATILSRPLDAPLNETSEEVPPSGYASLVAGATDPEGFLTDNISDAADNGG
jgi:hypothetical protein